MSEGNQRAFPDEIARYYREAPEEDRLNNGPSRLEAARTKEVALRVLLPSPGTVLDVGGASGAYAFWLAELGYQVHLVDLAPRLIDVARGRNEAAPRPLASIQIGDARDLPFSDGFADAVLLLGPLYHLTDQVDRLRALREAHRVLRPGGVLLAAGISRYASALDGVSRDLFADPSFVGIVAADLKDGQHRNPTEEQNFFTTAYLHRPEDLRDEVTGAGFSCQGVLGVEGPGWMLPDFDARWADARQRDDLLRIARGVESEASIVGMSAHLLAIGTRN